MAGAAHNTHKYHVEMMLSELGDICLRRKGDTRVYLSLDEGEVAIVRALLQQELAAIARTINA